MSRRICDEVSTQTHIFDFLFLYNKDIKVENLNNNSPGLDLLSMQHGVESVDRLKMYVLEITDTVLS